MKRTYPINDSELVELFIAGDQNAYGLLYTKHRERVFRLIVSIVKNSKIAEDISHDVFIKAMSVVTSDTYRNENFSAWILTIARNLAIDHLRDAKRHAVQSLDHAMNEGHVASYLADNSLIETEESRERAVEVRKLINMLPPDQKDVIMLRYFDGLKCKDTAKLLGIPLGTNNGKIRYALMRMRAKLPRTSLEGKVHKRLRATG